MTWGEIDLPIEADSLKCTCLKIIIRTLMLMSGDDPRSLSYHLYKYEAKQLYLDILRHILTTRWVMKLVFHRSRHSRYVCHVIGQFQEILA